MKTDREKALFRIAERLCEHMPGADIEEVYNWLPAIIPITYQEAEEELEDFRDTVIRHSPSKPSVFGKLRTALHAEGCGLKTVLEAAIAKVEQLAEKDKEIERLKRQVSQADYLLQDAKPRRGR